MLSFVHPLPEDLKQGLRLQKVQEPVVIPAEYNYPYSAVVLPGVDCPSEAPRPVFAALAGPDVGVTPAQAWEATVAFLFGCEWVASTLERNFQYPLLYADAPAYARALCGAGEALVGWLFFAHKVDQAFTHLGDPGLARIGTLEEIEAQFRQYVSTRMLEFHRRTTYASPVIRQLLLMRLGKAPWQEQQPEQQQQEQQ